MIRLSYDTAYDPYHTAFRIFRLGLRLPRQGMDFSKIRILDFYLNFPFLLKNFLTGSLTLTKPALSSLKKVDLTQYPQPYANLPDSRTLLEQMRVFQLAAIETMCIRGLADPDEFARENVLILPQNAPAALYGAADERNSQQSTLIDFLSEHLASIPLNGPSGLKARTKLLEHRHDIV